MLSTALNIDFARAVGDMTTVEMGKIAYKYPEKSVLTYLKKHFGNKDWCFPLLSIILALVYWPEGFPYVSYNKRRYYYDGPEKNTRAYK